ncbi:MAG: vanadium-dependent haloperoxidase [Saprospiraceae bacterium]|nr:vanadium-dependent haloperoxidase [Saprospiraceae bacterium]
MLALRKIKQRIQENWRQSLVLSIFSLLIITAIGWYACLAPNKSYSEKTTELIVDWYNFFLEADRYSEGYRGSISARTFGYIGIAGIESARPVFKGDLNSLEQFLPGYKSINFHGNEPYILQAALNACYRKMFARFYLTAPTEVYNHSEALFLKWDQYLIKHYTKSQIESSKLFGDSIANSIYDYSTLDTIGHQAYLHIYDKQYTAVKEEGKWQISEELPMPPLLPYWGKVRPFVINLKDFIAKPLPEYSTLAGSEYYTEALEVLTISSPLSFENKWIAEFWSDDHPGLTFTPSTRWISITNQVICNELPSIEKTLETYLKIGIALTDASISCWNSKYLYNLERPESYIHKVFNKDWQPLFHTPPFPSYPSGHSIFGAAASEVLTSLYGGDYAMVDHSHEGRDEFMGTPRKFHSFYEMAFENAFSRIPLGVHFRMDCEEGLRLGFLVGKKVSAVQIFKQDYSSL